MSATANRAEVLRVKEATWGELPNNPAWTPVRMTGESLNNDITTEQSQEIRPDRALTDLVNVDAAVGGGVDFELSYGSFDDLLEALLMDSWTTVSVASVGGDIETLATHDDNLISVTPGKFASVRVGQSLVIDGFTDPGNNGVFKVVAKADDETLTLFPEPASAESATGADVEMTGDVLSNGITEQSFSLLRVFNDASPVARQLFSGMRVGSMSLEFSTGSIVTGSFTFLGRSAEWINAEPAGSTTNPASTTDVMNSVTNIFDINMNGVGLCATGLVSNFTLEVDNQHREQKGLCRLGAVGVVAGQLSVTVSGSQYFVNDAEAVNFEQSRDFSFSWGMEDADGNRYVFNLPRNKYESFAANASGLDTDIMSEVTFRSLLDTASGKVILISRLPAA